MQDFKLSDEFVDPYRSKEVPWGYQDGGGNSLGEITFLRTYSRLKPDGTKETWVDACRRVIEGMFTIQKRHCAQNRIEWKNDKAQRTAKDAFDRMFNMKWLPAGRGIWAMGSPIVMEEGNSAPLQSCAFISTKDSITEAMVFLFDASMLGIGVGFDAAGAGKFSCIEPVKEGTFVIPDSREGWVESLQILMDAYITSKQTTLPEFDYSQIRPAGEPIKRFGGTASGPAPLKQMHALIQNILQKRAESGSPLTLTDICDLGNCIGKCVVAGSVRRSAEVFFVDREDENLQEFVDLKNYEKNPERQEWGWLSNNSVRVKVGDDFSPLIPGIKLNGEPGLLWMDIARAYGRLKDSPDFKDMNAQGANPCLEQILFHKELCNLVEVFVNNCEDQDDFIKTLKVAYLYGKTVTLLPTKWEEVNTVMQRNRRIGLSVSGVADFVDTHGLASLRSSLDDGYQYVEKLDKKYSEWLCIRESIKRTSLKPSGSISILAGSSPGVHWTPGGEYFIRRITFSKTDPLFQNLKDAGYSYEDLEFDEYSAVILFPIHSKSKRSSSAVAAWEKIHLASELQYWWSDNAVSVTVDFKKSEADDIPTLLAMYDGKLKCVSFLPAVEGGAYKHMPFEQISQKEFNSMTEAVHEADFSVAYNNGVDAEAERYCTTDVCEIKMEVTEQNGEIMQVPEISLD